MEAVTPAVGLGAGAVDAHIIASLEALYSKLSRDPDFDTPELQAYDTADLLLTALAKDDLANASLSRADLSTTDFSKAAPAGDVVIVGDRHGALTLGLATVFGVSRIRTYQDPLLGERALAHNAAKLGYGGVYSAEPFGPKLFSGARIVLLQLPRGLAALDEIAREIAIHAAPDVRVYAGGRVKHMTRAQNEVLGKYFNAVTASRGWRKARVLTATGPKQVNARATEVFPEWAGDPDLDFQLAAFGATFGGAKLDHGSRLLLQTLRDRETAPVPLDPGGRGDEPRVILDLGCGNGVLATAAARMWPHATVIATDQSDAAVRATRLTAEAAGVGERIETHRADGTEAVASASVDLVLLNPPFHTGSAVHEGVGQRLIRDCARVLKPGGELRLVYNSHLNYRRLVEQVIGETWQLARDKTFTVLAAERH